MITPEQRFRELLAHAWARSPRYRQIYAAHGIRERDVPHLALHDLPVVGKAEVMAHFDAAVTDSRLRLEPLNRWMQQDSDPLNLYLDEFIVMYSSGGSSIRSVVPCTPREWQLTTAIVAPDILPADSGAPLRSAFYFTSAGHFASSTNVSRASHAAHEVLQLTMDAPLEETWARLNAFQPERLTSYASTMAWLAAWTLEGRLRIRPRSVLVSGDRLTPAARSAIERAWGADIYDLYASVEALYMAVRKPGGSEFQVLTGVSLLEVVDGAHRMVGPGERGRVLLTNLTNRTLPLIRFDLRDEAVLGRAGFGAETLEAIHGKAGMRLPVRLSSGDVGAIPLHDLHRLHVDGCASVQFVAHGPDHVEIRYEGREGLEPQIGTRFRALLAEASASVQSIRIERVARIGKDAVTKKHWDVVAPGRPTLPVVRLSEDVAAPQTVRPARGAPRPPVAERGSVFRRFQAVAAAHHDRVAVTDGARALTYGECSRAATRVARSLVRRGFDPTRPVAVLSGHTPGVIAPVLGILGAGGFYLGLDAQVPAERMRRILAETRPQHLVTVSVQDELARAVTEGSDTVVSRAEDLAAGEVDDVALPEPSPEAPACLLYTSGSTGAPRGIVFSHRTVLARVRRYSEDCWLGPDDGLSLLQSFAVSAGVRDMFGALLSGARLALYDIRARGLHALPGWLEQNRISVFYAVPTVWRLFLEALSGETFPLVRIVRLGGEAVQPRDVEGFKRHFSESCVLVNGYAATETDTICQYFMNHRTGLVANRVPVGRPVRGMSVRIVDGTGRQVVQAVGEVAVAGPTLARGRWDPHGRKIVPLEGERHATGDLGYQLADGRVFLTGRRDLVVKVAGHHVHLGEIEGALSGVPGVSEAAVVARSTPEGPAHITAYYVPADGRVAPVETLRQAVTSGRGGRAVPISFVAMAALPRLPGGKVNRDLLPPQAPSDRAPVERAVYGSETEGGVARIWEDVLGAERLPAEGDFFALGGDSVTAFRVLNRVRAVFGVDVPIVEFFGHATIAGLAALVRRLGSGRSD